jgi:hypothetical protein
MAGDAEQRKLAKLEKAVAYYLYIQSKDVADAEAGLYRAAAFALIGKPVDNALRLEAAKHKSIDDPLYSNDINIQPELIDLWLEHHPA